METRESSALCRATLMYSLRRSSVSTGSTTRMIWPSSTGFTPRSESRIAFSMLCIELLSNGEMMIIRASGVWNDASCWMGVGAP